MSPRVSAERREQYLKTRRNQILDAALEVFVDKGLDMATVDEIAQAAGISKGTIYLYFKSKDEIFDTILAERSSIPELIDWIGSTEKLMKSSKFSPQSFLENIGNKYLEAMENYYPLFRMVLANAHRYPAPAEHVYNNLFLRGNKVLAEFLSARVEAGEIKTLDSPLITARCFMGMLIVYVLSQEMLSGKKFTPINRNEWVKETVRLFLEGVQISKK
jgi:AcrR family transcriptional regulator